MRDHPHGPPFVRRAGQEIRPACPGSASGPIWVEPLFDGLEEGENSILRAVVEPGVRTNWHAHPKGQLLYVLSGIGHVQCAGGPVEVVGPGDCARFAPHQRHWHGAAPGSTFSYVSVQPVQGGTTVIWMEPVRDRPRAQGGAAKPAGR